MRIRRSEVLEVRVEPSLHGLVMAEVQRVQALVPGARITASDVVRTALRQALEKVGQ